MTPFNGCPVRACIVDLDGTMVDTLGDFDVAINHTLGELGYPPVSRQQIERRVGKGSEHLLRAVLALRGAGADLASVPAETVARAWTTYQRHYQAINGGFSTVFEGVVPGLEALRSRGLALACLTNKPQPFARVLLERKGLATFFGTVFGGDSFARQKPDPLPVLGTCEALGLAPAQVLMIGDSANDALAARAAGCPVVLVTYGYNHGQPVRAVDADAFVDSLADLPQLLGPGNASLSGWSAGV
jgi:phosphoglycolate phosphatase